MMLDCWQCCGAPRRGPHKYECIYSGPVTTSATPRRHDHRCPGCGDRIDCDYVCCEKCIPNRVVTGCPDCATLRARVAELEAQLATARAEERERCRTAVEEIGIREAGHGHAVSIGSYGHATDEDFDAAKRGCHYCVRVEVLHEAVQAIDALTPTPEPPHA